MCYFPGKRADHARRADSGGEWGLLHLGMSTRPFREVVALLTTLAGFDLLYTGVEQSILVAGVQSLITLGLALVGSYVITAPSMRTGEGQE